MVVACSRKRVVFGRIFEVKAEQSAWESVGVGGILREAIEAKNVENDAGVFCCHRCGGASGAVGRCRLRSMGMTKVSYFLLPSSLYLNISCVFLHLACWL